MNTVMADERGAVRVFALDLPPDQAARLRDDPGPEDGPAPLQALLGARYLDADFVEVFDVADLEGLGIYGYLRDGNGVSEADLAPHRAALEALSGWVVIVYSSAFGGFAQTLGPAPALRPIGIWHEARDPVVMTPLHSEAATTAADAPARKPPSQGAILGRVAVYALLVLFALTLVMVWIA